MFMKKVKEKTTDICDRWKEYTEKNFGRTQKSLYWTSTLLFSVIMGLLYADFGLPLIVGFIIACLVSFLLIHILFTVAVIALKILLRNGIRHFIYIWSMVILCATILIGGSCGNSSTVVIVLLSVLIIWMMQLFARSLYAMIKNKVYSRTIRITFMVTGLSLIAVIVFILGQGFEDEYIEPYLRLNQDYAAMELVSETFLAQQKNGEYTVDSLEYGMEKDSMLQSTVFNMSPYVGGYKGLQGIYRKLYQGYDIKEVPLAGKIWYPVEGSQCPVLFLAHGNHSFTTPSYLGYDYLGEYLASYGYVVISVDENFCNACDFGNLSQENDARAVLLLENMKQVQSYNNDKQSILYQKMDYENIAIAGHSRGGEMVADTVLFNQYANYPNNGNIRFNYHFNIKSVIAIAPTINQYKPAGHEVALSDINYLLLQGANDQDVSVFMGTKQYNNITFTGKGKYFKSYLYIAGANHGQFNTRWGTYDLIEPLNRFLNVKNLLEAKQQQDILKTLTKVFLDVTIKGDLKYNDLFYQYQKYAAYLPKTVYVQNYRDSGFDCVSNFEEDSNLGTATKENVVINAYGTTKWTEEMTRYSNQESQGERGNCALRLKWAKERTAVYEMNLKSYNANHTYFQFDIQDMDDKLVKKKEYNNLDGTIQLTDNKGEQASVKLSDYGTVYPSLPVRLGKLQYIFRNNEYKHQFQTIRISVSDLEEKNVDFDGHSVRKVEFLFDGDGSHDIMMDNIGFSRE